MAVTAASFKVYYTEFASLDDARVDLFLVEAATRVSADAWGGKYDYGIMKLTAHLIKANADAAAGGSGQNIVSESIGSISHSFGSTSSGDEELGTTRYGREFIQLRREIFADRVI